MRALFCLTLLIGSIAVASPSDAPVLARLTPRAMELNQLQFRHDDIGFAVPIALASTGAGAVVMALLMYAVTGTPNLAADLFLLYGVLVTFPNIALIVARAMQRSDLSDHIRMVHEEMLATGE